MTYDFTPLFRTAIGFDRLARLMDTAVSAEAPSYPPYNIEKAGEDFIASPWRWLASGVMTSS